MRTRPAALVALAACAIGLAMVQDPQPRVRAPEPDELRRARELARPTAEHAVLARLEGSWDVALVTHGPDGERHEDRGRAGGKAVLGGRHVVLELGLDLQHGRLDAVQLLGFDTMRGVYTASWRDSASTWPVRCEGAPGAEPRVVTMRGSLVDARSPSGRPFRLTMDLRADDRAVVTVHEGLRDDEVLVQEQTWTRR